MVVDVQAEKNKKRRQGGNIHWDIKVASLPMRGGKLTSQYKEQLKTQLHDKSLTTFIKEKESW
jgi:hypothetical protein